MIPIHLSAWRPSRSFLPGALRIISFHLLLQLARIQFVGRTTVRLHEKEAATCTKWNGCTSFFGISGLELRLHAKSMQDELAAGRSALAFILSAAYLSSSRVSSSDGIMITSKWMRYHYMTVCLLCDDCASLQIFYEAAKGSFQL